MRTGDNDNAANAVCRQMGYSSGEIYTFGSTSYLPTMPIVAGWRICHGGESDLFACEDKSPNYDIDDQDCINGCLGPDGRQGTLDDTIDSTCTHAVDQGAICHDDSSPSRVALERCSGGCACTDTSDQPIAFGCVDYFTTQCSYDITNSHLNGRESGAGQRRGSYSFAMRAFAQCASVMPEPEGYCHGSLKSAAQLANHEVCSGSNNNQQRAGDVGVHAAATQGWSGADAGGATTNIGLAKRIFLYGKSQSFPN